MVTLSGDSVNVRLLDSANLAQYRNGRRHRAYGGHVTRSPYRMTIPRDGLWYVVIDRGGYAVNARASVRVEPARSARVLPPARQDTPDVAAVGRNAMAARAAVTAADVDVDVFVSHASEDKEEIVRPLARELGELGLEVWYDESTLRVGDSLRRKIDQGIARARFGIVVLSRSLFAKNWPQYELDGLVTRELNGDRQIILPIWHNITKDEIISQSPSLADKVALRTADLTVREIAEQISAAVNVEVGSA